MLMEFQLIVYKGGKFVHQTFRVLINANTVIKGASADMCSTAATYINHFHFLNDFAALFMHWGIKETPHGPKQTFLKSQ